jgi:16S rRNA (cytidine1402-2'-O)-methyltransferase
MRDHPRSHPQPRKADLSHRSERTDGLSGTLFVVATPIGNLEDITLRALRVLREADLVACEDTRRTRALLTHFDIHKPTVSYYAHNTLTRGPELLRELAAGRSIALVTDAGTPGISDPGVLLVREARAHGVPVVPVPGPAALVAGLSAAGIPADRFVFDGFLPVKPGKRINRLKALRALDTTVVLYESPHRIAATLGAIGEVYGEVELVVARELTKQFEDIVRATPAAHLAGLGASGGRGEFTLVIPAAGPAGEAGP